MRKIMFSLIILSFFACEKDDPIDKIMVDLAPVELPSNVLGKWRWVQSAGGFTGSVVVRDSNRKQILTISTNKQLQLCVNDTCHTGKWAYGSRVITSSNNTSTKDTILMLKNTNSWGSQTVFHAKNVTDTLILHDDCNDCFGHTYVRIK